MHKQGEANPNEPKPEIRSFTLGPYATNCYVVSAMHENGRETPDSRDCWIVDASFDPEPIIRHVREAQLRPLALVLTHAHVDHIAGASEVVSAFSNPARGERLPVWIHPDEAGWLNDPVLNLSAMDGRPVTAPGPDRFLEDGQTLSLAGMTWNVLHTPGHSPGGICLHHAPSHTAIVGDALFAGSIGRTDFPGGDHEQLLESIRSRLYTLPPQTRVYPGHGPSTTIERERRFNPFVRA